MAWKAIETIDNLTKLGPNPPDPQSVEGRFIGVKETNRYEGELCFQIQTPNGPVFLKGNPSLAQKLRPDLIGKVVRVSFKEYFQTSFGSQSYNVIVEVWDGEGSA